MSAEPFFFSYGSQGRAAERAILPSPEAPSACYPLWRPESLCAAVGRITGPVKFTRKRRRDAESTTAAIHLGPRGADRWAEGAALRGTSPKTRPPRQSPSARSSSASSDSRSAHRDSSAGPTSTSVWPTAHRRRSGTPTAPPPPAPPPPPCLGGRLASSAHRG